MADSVTIPAEIISEFRAQSAADFAGGTNGSQGNSIGTAAAEKAATWGLDWLDRLAQDQGYPGLAGLDSGELAELIVIVAERQLGADFLKNSPEIMLATAVSGIIASNVIAGRQKKEPPAEPEPGGGDE